jgi:hypothetical protein
MMALQWVFVDYHILESLIVFDLMFQILSFAVICTRMVWL